MVYKNRDGIYLFSESKSRRPTINIYDDEGEQGEDEEKEDEAKRIETIKGHLHTCEARRGERRLASRMVGEVRRNKVCLASRMCQ